MLPCLLAMADFFPLSFTTVLRAEETSCAPLTSVYPSLTPLNRRSESRKGKEKNPTPATSSEDNDLAVAPKAKP